MALVNQEGTEEAEGGVEGGGGGRGEPGSATRGTAADLSRFDPASRLGAASNREGDIFFTDINVGLGGLDLDLPNSLALHQVRGRGEVGGGGMLD